MKKSSLIYGCPFEGGSTCTEWGGILQRHCTLFWGGSTVRQAITQDLISEGKVSQFFCYLCYNLANWPPNKNTPMKEVVIHGLSR